MAIVLLRRMGVLCILNCFSSSSAFLTAVPTIFRACKHFFAVLTGVRGYASSLRRCHKMNYGLILFLLSGFPKLEGLHFGGSVTFGRAILSSFECSRSRSVQILIGHWEPSIYDTCVHLQVSNMRGNGYSPYNSIVFVAIDRVYIHERVTPE